jgi:hypothetical protein
MLLSKIFPILPGKNGIYHLNINFILAFSVIQLFNNWSELRLGPVIEVPINPATTWGDNG